MIEEVTKTPGWSLSAPTLTPNENGDTVVASLTGEDSSEYYEWGICKEGLYERYEWRGTAGMGGKNYRKPMDLIPFLQQILQFEESSRNTLQESELEARLAEYEEARKLATDRYYRNLLGAGDGPLKVAPTSSKAEEKSDPADAWFCTECGARHTGGKFCSECGTKRYGAD